MLMLKFVFVFDILFGFDHGQVLALSMLEISMARFSWSKTVRNGKNSICTVRLFVFKV